jgi:5,5'-dehydrodivanillate O-demethylase
VRAQSNVSEDFDARESIAYDRTGPTTPAGRYLRSFWTPVAESTDVPAGQARTIQIMSQRFTLFRGASGEPHLVADLCAHRHTALGTGWVDGDCIRCLYHGWLFDGSGQCREQPAEDEGFAEKVRIAAYPVREYMGLVFAYLGEGEPPAFQTIGVLEGPGILLHRGYTRRTNYFNSFENGCDFIHSYFVHARSVMTTAGALREIPKVSAEETEFGLTAYQRFTDGKVGMTYILMPLGMYIGGFSTPTPEEPKIFLTHHVAWRVPIDDASHRSFVLTFAELTGDDADRYRENEERAQARMRDFPPRAEIMDAIDRGEIKVDDVDIARPDIVNIQDAVVQEAQPLMSEREPDRLARSDGPVILLRKIYNREVRAFAQGKPTKRWTLPKDLRIVARV